MRDFTDQAAEKFNDPRVTATGEPRARVEFTDPQTLWFNTGTLCNIACANCYIESSPTNDALVYLSASEVQDFLGQERDRRWKVREIGFTGGEPFLNPDIIAMLRLALEHGFDVLVLTNAMRPIMRPAIQAGLRELSAAYGQQLTLRVSIDHWSADLHDKERGAGSFLQSLSGMRWLHDQGIRMTVAGRTVWGEDEPEARAGYARLFAEHGFGIDAFNPEETVLFPEMDASVDVPEITESCWGVLGKSPSSIMCASSRMVVKRRGAPRPSVLACTLIAFDKRFELGESLAEAERPVALNHPHCAKFCVLGGASCSP